jgi:hypothetical protein
MQLVLCYSYTYIIFVTIFKIKRKLHTASGSAQVQNSVFAPVVPFPLFHSFLHTAVPLISALPCVARDLPSILFRYTMHVIESHTFIRFSRCHSPVLGHRSFTMVSSQTQPGSVGHRSFTMVSSQTQPGSVDLTG